MKTSNFILLTLAMLYCSISSAQWEEKYKNLSREDFKKFDMETYGMMAPTFWGTDILSMINTDIDIMLRNRSGMKDDFMYQVIEANKEHFKVYRDVNNAIIVSFRDRLIYYNDLFRREHIYMHTFLKKAFVCIDQNWLMVEDSSVKGKLYNYIAEYRNTPGVIEDKSTHEMVKGDFPNYITLEYDSIRGMSALYYDKLDKVWFECEYFIKIADIFREACKKHGYIKIIATVPVLYCPDSIPQLPEEYNRFGVIL